jgi:hypothetical protein
MGAEYVADGRLRPQHLQTYAAQLQEEIYSEQQQRL